MLVDGKGATCISGVPKRAYLIVALTHSKPCGPFYWKQITHKREYRYPLIPKLCSEKGRIIISTKGQLCWNIPELSRERPQ